MTSQSFRIAIPGAHGNGSYIKQNSKFPRGGGGGSIFHKSIAIVAMVELILVYVIVEIIIIPTNMQLNTFKGIADCLRGNVVAKHAPLKKNMAKCQKTTQLSKSICVTSSISL